MANRQDIIDRIRAMRAKAEDAAATEAEAMAAAEMAAKLLIKYDIKPEELAEIGKAEGVEQAFRQGKVGHPVAEAVAVAVSELTETKVYRDRAEIKFIGLEEDVLMAVYLIEMLVGAAKRAWVGYSEDNYKEAVPFKQLMHFRESFFVGFSARVSMRLNELRKFREEQRAQAQSTGHGTALVIVKQDIIRRKMEEMGLVLGKARRKNKTYDSATFMQGAAAGETVNLNRPFAGNASTGATQ